MPTLLEGKNEEIEVRGERAELETPPPGLGADPVLRQRRQMMIALGLLLLALAIVIIKDWKFLEAWFAPAQRTTGEQLEKSIITPEPAKVTQPPVVSARRLARANEQDSEKKGGDSTPGIVATNRAVLPPLEIEVVAGRSRRAVNAASSALKVDLSSDDEPAASQPEKSSAVTYAAESVKLSPDTRERVSRTVEPSYPLLAKQMKVQGSVVLQALIGRNGNIEDLRVLSGPAILSSAAMEAVKQWSFRPYVVDGAPVETQARITVNFTISTY